jgi:hypothetical protein
MKDVLRYRNLGGAMVTWTHDPGNWQNKYGQRYGTWSCDGCGQSDTYVASAAENHAKTCSAC